MQCGAITNSHIKFPITIEDVQCYMDDKVRIPSCVARIMKQTCHLSLETSKLILSKKQVQQALKRKHETFHSKQKLGALFAQAVYFNQLRMKIADAYAHDDRAHLNELLAVGERFYQTMPEVCSCNEALRLHLLYQGFKTEEPPREEPAHEEPALARAEEHAPADDVAAERREEPAHEEPALARAEEHAPADDVVAERREEPAHEEPALARAEEHAPADDVAAERREEPAHEEPALARAEEHAPAPRRHKKTYVPVRTYEMRARTAVHYPK